jgi:trimethylamine--corrinoid protein Co-methyltransferase
VEVNDETLALDVIEELGPTGSFLEHDHTLRHYKEPFYSQLADKNQYSLWLEQGGKTMEARAAEMVDTILGEHQPEPLPEDVQVAIKKIVQREQAWIENIDPD